MGSRPGSRLEALVTELCTQYGWCAASRDIEALDHLAAADPGPIVDAILRAEGFNAEIDAPTRGWLTDLVMDCMFDPAGRGAQSGLPG